MPFHSCCARFRVCALSCSQQPSELGFILPIAAVPSSSIKVVGLETSGSFPWRPYALSLRFHDASDSSAVVPVSYTSRSCRFFQKSAAIPETADLSFLLLFLLRFRFLTGG